MTISKDFLSNFELDIPQRPNSRPKFDPYSYELSEKQARKRLGISLYTFKRYHEMNYLIHNYHWIIKRKTKVYSAEALDIFQQSNYKSSGLAELYFLFAEMKEMKLADFLVLLSDEKGKIVGDVSIQWETLKDGIKAISSFLEKRLKAREGILGNGKISNNRRSS